MYEEHCCFFLLSVEKEQKAFSLPRENGVQIVWSCRSISERDIHSSSLPGNSSLCPRWERSKRNEPEDPICWVLYNRHAFLKSWAQWFAQDRWARPASKISQGCLLYISPVPPSVLNRRLIFLLGFYTIFTRFMSTWFTTKTPVIIW